MDSILRSYNISFSQSCFDASSFRQTLISLSEDKLAFATRKHLIITQGIVGAANIESPVQTIVEFLEEYGMSTALKWISAEIICVGFENGCISCFLTDGSLIFEHSGHTSAVQSLRVSNRELYNGMGLGLWVLFEGGYLLTIPLKNIFNGNEDGIGRFKFPETSLLNDFIFLPNNLLRGLKQTDVSHSILVSGQNPALAYYSIGGKLQYANFGKLSGFGKDKVGTAISKTLTSFFGGAVTVEDKGKADATEEVVLDSSFDFEDTKRRILRMSIEPRGKLVACADSLGRVLLFDTRTNASIRLWKGVRDARLAWSEGVPVAAGAGAVGVSLCLSIYAPQIGILSLYAMRHGPCLRTIPVGPQAHILTIFEKNLAGERLAKCGLLHFNHSAPSPAADEAPSLALKLTIISPFGTSNGYIEDAALAADLAQAALSDANADVGSKHSEALVRIERKIFSIIQQRSDSKLTRENSVKVVGHDIEAELLTLMTKIESCGDLVCAVDIVDISGRLDSFLPLYDPNMSTTVLHPILNEFFRKLNTLYPRRSEVKQSTGSFQTQGDIAFDSPVIAAQSEALANAKFQHRVLPIRFSNSFHLAVCRLLMASSTSSIAASGQRRLVALQCFELLSKQCSSGDECEAESSSDFGIDSFKVSKSDVDFMDELLIESKKNTSRSEALCWLLRIRGMSTVPESPLPVATEQSVSTSSSASPMSPTMPKQFKTSAIHSVSSLSRSFPLTSPGATSPVSSNRKSISSHSEHSRAFEIGDEDDNAATFPLFLSFFDAGGNFKARELADMIDGMVLFTDREILRSKFPVYSKIADSYRFGFLQYFSDAQLSVIGDVDYLEFQWHTAYNKSAVGGVLSSYANSMLQNGECNMLLENLNKCNILTAVLSSSVPQRLSSFLFSPLVKDVFSLKSYLAVLSSMKLSGQKSLTILLPLILIYFERATLKKISSLAMKQLTVSPFQRWLRDNILFFEEELKGSSEVVDVSVDAGPAPAASAAATCVHEDILAEFTRLSGHPEAIQSVLMDACELLPAAPSVEASCPQAQPSQTFDDCVRSALEPAKRFVRQSPHLDAALVFTTLVLETLSVVGDQIERRSYGDMNLRCTINEWTHLRKQLRTTLFLSCRCGSKSSRGGTASKSVSSPIVSLPLTVESLDNGLTSIFALLAADTLCFASKAEHAVEHENRCLQVYSRRVSSGSDSLPLTNEDALQSNRVLLAWGLGSDKRWRELIQVTESEDQIQDEETGSSQRTNEAKKKSELEVKKIRRRRPLLIFFPQHNSTNYLGVYRVLTLLQKWLKKPSKIELLGLTVDHLLQLSPTFRASISYMLLRKTFIPLVNIFFQLENNPSERPKQSLTQKECIAALSNAANLEVFLKIVIMMISYTQIAPGSCDLPTDSEPSSDCEAVNIWPPTQDSFVNHTLGTFRDSTYSFASYLGVLWVLMLRSLCGLRGIKPIQLFKPDELAAGLIESNCNTENPALLVDNIIDIRYEFVLQCFRRVDVDCDAIVYRLAGSEGWNMDINHIHLAHITALLDQGDVDDQAEEIIVQVSDLEGVIDCVLECFRMRIGNCIARIEKLPGLARVVSIMDSSAVNWVRSSVGSPDPAIVEAIANGSLPPLCFNLSSTRHLIIRMHSLLLSELGVSREAPWIARRERVDALLSICTTLGQLQPNNK